MSDSRRFLPEELGGLEAVMPVASKDFSKVPYATKLLLENTAVSRVHVITDSDTELSPMDGVVYHREGDVLPYGSDFFDFRPKWIFQQMLKLMQDVTGGEWYISVDADTFVVKPISLWDESGPYLFHEVNSGKIIVPYDNFNKAFLGSSNYPFSALNNIVLFNKSIIRDIMERVGAKNSLQFAEKVRMLIGPGFYPAEAQLYLSWLLDNESGLYRFPTMRVGWRGMYGAYVFNDRQVSETIDYHSKNLDILLLHSWEVSPSGWTGGEYSYT